MSRRKKSAATKQGPRTRDHNATGAAAIETTTFALSLRDGLVFALVVLAVVVAYLPAMQGGFLWDDDAHVTKAELQSLPGLGRIWFELGATQQYYPVLHSAFWLEHRLWGDAPLGYHLANVLLHAAAACLAIVVLRRLRVPGAWLAGALFALHPVHVESVAWITEQKNTLSAVFYLSAMLAYLRFDATRSRWAYTLALALFLLGLGSKTVTATLPAALLVIFWWRRGTLSWRRDVVPLLPWFALGAAAGLLTAWVERTLIGAEGAEHELAPLARVLLAGRVVWFYLGKLAWPADLMFIYPRWSIDTTSAVNWLYLAATLATFALLWFVRTRWRSPLASWLLFVGTLFPVLGFLNVYPFLFSFVADHFQYLASLSMLALAAAGAALGVMRLSGAARAAAQALCLLVLAVLATLTWRQCRTYSDVQTLYRVTLERNPECWLAYNNLGRELAREGKIDQSVAMYQESLRLKPNFSIAHFNLANELAALGRADDAVRHYREAVSIRPDYPEALNNLGAALLKQGQGDEAIRYLRLAVGYKPNHAAAQVNLGTALLARGDAREAAGCFEQALGQQPSPEAHAGLGNALMKLGRPQAAEAEFHKALALAPEMADAHNSLGVVLAKSGRVSEAIRHFEQALAQLTLSPGDALTAHANLTTAYMQTGQADRAIATAERAVELARAQGETEMADQISAWLADFRKRPPQPPGNSKSAAPAPPGRP